ncbi:ferredoxin [Nocardioides sp. zg-DK7169]|uniref:ferredoxin n=1 Tax=Nocardioides sp. zg-DK7169 TaxID=2736600 RepID=UPI001554884F|nr:ferredoxin [Nocardioides sp. zg-DK7169]NPC98667.1 ferredoxin [Nocardioides sp. zg-DK7169]
MAVRPDVRLDDAPMQPVSCTSCGVSVQARKSSWDQTTLQWNDAALEACVERRASVPRPGPNGATFVGCFALRDSVRAAAVRGDLDVLSDEPLPSNPAALNEVSNA